MYTYIRALTERELFFCMTSLLAGIIHAIIKRTNYYSNMLHYCHPLAIIDEEYWSIVSRLMSGYLLVEPHPMDWGILHGCMSSDHIIIHVRIITDNKKQW